MIKSRRFCSILMAILFAAAFLVPCIQAGESGKININSASVEELSQIKGIGPKLAEKIIQYRTEHGAFKAVEDLVNIKGIGEASLNKIKDSLTVQ